MSAKRFVVSAIGVFASLTLLTACGGGSEEAAAPESESAAETIEAAQADSRLLDAAEACKALDTEGSVISVSPDGTSMFVDTEDENDFGGYLVFVCVQEELDFSEPLKKSIENTSALNGTKTWDENGMAMEWNYHPDNGVGMSVRLVGASS